MLVIRQGVAGFIVAGLMALPVFAISPALRVAVVREGPCRVGAAALAAGLNLTADHTAAALSNAGFTVTRAGQPVAWTPAPDGGGLLFFGLPNDSVESRETVYWVTAEPGPVMGSESHAGNGVDAAAEPVGVYMESLHLESNLWSTLILDSMPAADYLLWKYLPPSQGSYFLIPVPDYAGTGAPVRVGVSFRSLHPEDDVDSHDFAIALDGTELGRATWSGMREFAWSASLPAAQALAPEGGFLTIVEQTGLLAGRAGLKWIELAYPRGCRASGDRLILSSDAPTNWVIAGFSNAPVTVWDVTLPDSPVVLTGLVAAARDGGYAIGFRPPAANHRYAIFAELGLLAPDSLRAGQAAPELADATNAADWVAVVPPLDRADFRWGAERLAAFRARQGLRTRVVTGEAIADTFGGGICSTGAIRAFVQATAAWSVRPRSLVLMGYGNLDSRCDSAVTACLLPTPARPIVFSPVGDRKGEVCSADSWYGDDNGDGVPEVVIGRLPVATSNELATALSNIERFEESGAWKSNALFTADNPTNNVTEGLDLHVATDEAAAELQAGGFGIQRNYVPASQLTSRVIRPEVLSVLSNRVSLILHLGHGDAGQIGWGSVGNGILVNTQFGLAQNWDFPPIGVFATCQINRFHNPSDSNTFSLACWRKPGTGFAALVAPSSKTIDLDGVRLGRELMRAWAATNTLTLGDAVMTASAAALGGLYAPATLACLTVLGDPATTIRFDRTALGTDTAWLRERGLTAPNADADDPDGDSFPTWVEFREGGEPLAIGDHPLRFHAAQAAGGRLALTFVSGPGSRYRVRMAPALAPTREWTLCATALTESGAWREPGVPVVATALRTTVFVPAEGPAGFFKIEVAP